jgi:rhodanese-related sulfurtransferase
MKPYLIGGIIILLLIVAIFGWKWAKVLFAKDYDTMLQSLYSKTVPTINVDSIDNLEGYIILDTRAKEEWGVSHLPNAIWVNYPKADLSCLEGKDKSQAILVYCSVGYRSEKIGEQIQALGFKNVKNIYGGIFEWVNKEKNIIDTAGNSIQKVHGFSPSWGKWMTNNKIEKVYE